MTKRLIIIASFALCAFTNSMADEVDINNGKGFYIGASAGIYRTAEDFKEIKGGYVKSYLKTRNFQTLAYGGFAGYKFNQFLRADVNGQIREFQYGATEDRTKFSQKIRNYTLFVNGYVSLPTETVFTPYATIGIGYSHNQNGSLEAISSSPDVNFNAPGKDTNNFAWNIGLGTRLKLYESFDLDVGYRYVDLGDVKTDSTASVASSISAASQKLRIHQGMLGLIYSF